MLYNKTNGGDKVPDYITVSKLAERVGVNKKTIRYYEEIGLLDPMRASNGYRLFDLHDEKNLVFIKRLQRLGLSLKDIGIILNDVKSGLCDSTKIHLKELITEKVEDIENRISELHELKKYLIDQFEKIDSQVSEEPSQVKECSCLDENK